MSLKSLALATAAVIALSGASLAATTTKPATPATHTTAAATTKPAKTAKTADTSSTFSKAELKAAVSLSTIKDAKDKFATAKIDDTQGNVIGPVKEVVVGKTGLPTAIQVDVSGWLGVPDRVVSINAKRVSYIEDRGVLLTKMSKAQIEKLKPVKVKG